MDMQQPPRAADGRQWKNRHINLAEVIDQVVQTKKDTPSVAEVQKTAATRSGLVVSYMVHHKV
jgi:hypothetical protein